MFRIYYTPVSFSGCAPATARRTTFSKRMCICDLLVGGDKPPGFDRKPTEAEEAAPPSESPWTEYDSGGNKQKKPGYKAVRRSGLYCSRDACLEGLR